MGAWNRLWIFYVIIAVGLVFGWQQLAHKANQPTVRTDLDTESPCRPFAVPCAAFGSDIALVLGPGPENDLLLKASGRHFAGIPRSEVLAPRRAAVPVSTEFVAPGVWRLRLVASDVPERSHLVIEIDQAGVRAVFPLTVQ